MVAAGRGTRMGAKVDKLFLELAERPVVVHTWQRLEETAEVAHIIVVVREGMEAHFRGLHERHGLQKPFCIVAGGPERQDSVWNGLAALPAQTEIVVIQDAARPCISPGLIAETIRAAREIGAAVAAQPVTDTIKESMDGKFVTRTLDRSKLWAVQTPQTFRVEVIRRGLEEVRARGLVVTDDTAACELIGQPVQLVASVLPNPKVTRPEDLDYVQAVLQGLGHLNK